MIRMTLLSYGSNVSGFGRFWFFLRMVGKGLAPESTSQVLTIQDTTLRTSPAS